MTSFNSFNDRFLLPRVLPFAVFKAPSQASITPAKLPYNTEEVYKEAKDKWDNNQSVANAIEYTLASSIFGDPTEAKKAALFLKNKPISPIMRPAIKSLLLNLGIHESPSPIWDGKKKSDSIKQVRKRLRSDPYNPIDWCDAAFFHSMLGNTSKAVDSARVALNLGGDSRYVLRQMTALLEIHGNPDEALHYLRRSPRTKLDPWLLSTDISIADKNDLKQLLTREAKSILNSSNYSKRFLTELNGSYATLELNSGRKKKSRKLFLDSLDDPTENSLAQAEWATKDLSIEVDSQNPRVDLAFEARAIDAYYRKDYSNTLDESIKWAHYQPLTPDPWIFSSYISASLHEDYVRSKDIALMGLTINKNSMLVNNMLYACALDEDIGGIMTGLKLLETITVEKEAEPILKATYGLIEFAKNNFKEGIKKYDESIASFLGDKKYERAAIALYNFALAKHKYNLPYSDERSYAIKMLKKYHSKPEKEYFISKLESLE
ncbi:hypothetical protein KQI63_07505 [bacterium]|nr:hypothetical protein [bacterium]